MGSAILSALALFIFLHIQSCYCMSADLENFEIVHTLDDEDFENRHIAIEAMIRAPWPFA